MVLMNKHKFNPITQELLDAGILEFRCWEKPRKVIDTKTGEERIEIVSYTKTIDRRQYVKAFVDRWSILYGMFEGVPKAQMLFYVEYLVSKNINKDFIFINYKDYVSDCLEHKVSYWKQPQFSKMIKVFLDNALIAKSEENGKYFFNTKYFYNGSLALQMGIKE